MKVAVKILPRPEVLDTQGRAVEKTLSEHEKVVGACRVGRYVELEFEEVDPTKALDRAKDIAEFVLYNPLIETYQLEVV